MMIVKKFEWTEWTEGQGGKLLEKNKNSRTKLTIFDILKKITLSNMTILQTFWTWQFFSFFKKGLFLRMKIRNFLAVWGYVTMSTLSILQQTRNYIYRRNSQGE